MSAEGSAALQGGNENSVESGATPLELFLPRVCVRLHPGHELPLQPPHLGRNVNRAQGYSQCCGELG